MSRSWNFTQSAPAPLARSTSSLASPTEPLWLMPISAMRKAGCPRPTSWRPTWKASLRLTATATRWPCSSSSGTWSMAPTNSRRISAGVAVEGALRDPGVGDVGAGAGEVDLGLGGDPAAHVAVADRADEVPVLGDAEDDPGLVGADLLQRGEHRVLAVDDEGPDGPVDDHAGLPDAGVGVRSEAWVSVRSATSRSSSVSTSMPSSSSMTNSPTRPPIRLSSSS